MVVSVTECVQSKNLGRSRKAPKIFEVLKRYQKIYLTVIFYENS